MDHVAVAAESDMSRETLRAGVLPAAQGLALEGMGEERRLTSTSAAWRRPCGKVVVPCAPSISIALPSIIDVLGTAIGLVPRDCVLAKE